MFFLSICVCSLFFSCGNGFRRFANVPPWFNRSIPHEPRSRNWELPVAGRGWVRTFPRRSLPQAASSGVKRQPGLNPLRFARGGHGFGSNSFSTGNSLNDFKVRCVFIALLVVYVSGRALAPPRCVETSGAKKPHVCAGRFQPSRICPRPACCRQI